MRLFTENGKPTLRKKLAVLSTLITTFAICAIIIISYFSGTNVLTSKIEEVSMKLVKQLAVNTNNYLINVEETAHTVITDATTSSSLDIDKENFNESKDHIQSLLTRFQSIKGYEEYFIIYGSGEIVGASSTSKNVELYKTFSQALGSQNNKWLINKDYKPNLLFNLRKVAKSNNGILVTGINKNELNDIVGDDLENNASEIVLLNENKETLFSTVEENINTQLDEKLINKIKDEKGSFNYDGNIVNYVTLDNGFILLDVMEKSYLLKELNTSNAIIIIIGVVFITVASILANYFAKKLSRPIVELSALMGQLEKGDFTAKSTVKRADEIGDLANSFNVMTENVSKSLNSIIDVSNSINDKINSVKNISCETLTSSQGISNVMQTITDGATKQSEQSSMAIDIMDDLTNSINDVIGSIDKAFISSDNTKKLGDSSLIDLNTLKNNTNEVGVTFENINSTINELINNIKNIEDFVEIINNISEQTNLLSLNAQIESARAGEFGKSFGVVANEVKKLAEQSSQSANDIKSVIKIIQEQATKTTTLLNNSAKVYDIQKVSVNNTLSSFNNILKSNIDIEKELERAKSLANSMNRKKDKTTTAIDTISTVAEESTAIVEEVLASTEIQTVLSQNLNNLTNDLYDNINTLNTVVNKFKTKA